MTNNNHKNKDCGYTEELVSYLYGETKNAAFETHLATCAACADELAAISGVRFSINDWKAKEFDRLETPVFEVPYKKRDESTAEKGSWFSGLRALFTFTPSWSLAGASLAVLTVCVGLFFYGSKIQNNNLISENNSKPQKSATPPADEKKAQTNANQNTAPQKPTTPEIAPKQPSPDVVVTRETNPKNNRVIKTSDNSRPVKENVKTPKNNNMKRNKNEREVSPGVIEDDEEDDTLRLAEIFEEIDTED